MLVTWCLAGTVIVVLVPSLGYHIMRPLDRALHWTERARRLAPLRSCVAVGAAVLVPGSLWIGWQIGGWMTGAQCALASFVGAQLSARIIGLRTLRAMDVPLPFDKADARKSFLGKLPLQAAWLAPFVLMAVWPRPTTIAAVAAVLALTLVYVRWQSHWLTFVGHFRGAHSTVLERVRAVSDGSLVRGVFQTEIGLANAMALPWSRELAVTRGCVHVLSVEELDAVLAHEIEHLEESLSTRLSRLGPLVGRVLLGAVAGYTASLTDLPLGLLILCLSSAAAMLLWRLALELWRRGERQADDAGGGHDGPAYGRALIVLYHANLFPIASLTAGGHAPLLERLKALGIEPDFAAPRRHSQVPSGLTFALTFAYAIGMIAVSG